MPNPLPRENELLVTINVKDEFNQPLEGVTVTWEIPYGTGTDTIVGSTTFNGTTTIDQLVGVGIIPTGLTITLTKTGYTTIQQSVVIEQNSTYIWSTPGAVDLNYTMYSE